MDPPYMLTLGSYNDGKRGFSGWTKVHEYELFNFANKINQHGAYFMISYVSEHKNKFNNELISWVYDNNYNLIELPYISGKNRKEISGKIEGKVRKIQKIRENCYKCIDNCRQVV